jgi:hypothetical protein
LVEGKDTVVEGKGTVVHGILMHSMRSIQERERVCARLEWWTARALT